MWNRNYTKEALGILIFTVQEVYIIYDCLNLYSPLPGF
uniref:Uncharacterized protein n=1 Tax=Anguilla anguilla TaxID=7936 RepID=A0A0E9TNI2_ANGAN